MRKAIVTPVGGEPVEVEIPAGHPDPAAVAVIAYRKKAAAWEDARRVTVEFPDATPE
jgi:hypothetical protein